MRIIGGHDYYDCMMQYGQDDQIIFVRNSKIDECVREELYSLLPKNYIEIYKNGKRWKSVVYNGNILIGNTVLECDFRPVLIIVADEVHFGVCVRNEPNKIKYYWSDEEFSKDFLGYSIKFTSTKEIWNNKNEVFDFGMKNVSKELKDFMIKNNISIVTRFDIGSTSTHEINKSNLKDFEFYRKMIPQDIYAKIYNWVGGVIPTKSRNVVNITDSKVLMAKHGMGKMSFKKGKSL